MAESEHNTQEAPREGIKPEQSPFYDPNLETVAEPARTLLEKYSGIPADQITEHVKKVVS
jgi:hypothetical protein